MASLPHLTRRRLPWPCYAVSAFILVVVLFHTSSYSRSGSLTPLPFQSSFTGPSVLRPGEYHDESRVRPLPEPDNEAPLFEPNGPGTAHDARNDKFYEGGIATLTSKNGDAKPEPVVFQPYPAYNTEEWRAQWKGDFRACRGPRGRDLDHTNPQDMMSVYRGNQKDFPFPMFGSHEVLGLDPNVCTDRCSRFGVYGHDEGNYDAGCHRPAMKNWDRVNWGSLQAHCASANSNRYFESSIVPNSTLPLPEDAAPRKYKIVPAEPEGPQYHSRSAVLIRGWTNMIWTPSHRQYLRSLIMELSLHSGGEFEVFLLVDMKDSAFRLSEKDDVKRLKEKYIPKEFHDITIFFNEELLEKWYPEVPEHTPKFQHLQPIQVFSQIYPHFDYVWQFEMDARNTGHWYHLLERAADFAKWQPRKFLWERNSYFYTPGAHGTWDDFFNMVDKSMTPHEDKSVWGPVPVNGWKFSTLGPDMPAGGIETDLNVWGRAEEADLLTFLPIFDARDTEWTFPDKIWNVPENVSRRASPITMWRMSRKLLGGIHEAQKEGKAVVSEMTGPTFALWHGLKAVHVPHPMWVDGQWTAHEVAKIYNPGKNEKVNGGSDSIWKWDHAWDHIMYRISYMFTTQLAEDLFRRWLGYPMDPNQYSDGKSHKDGFDRTWYESGILDEEKYGRLCFPPMLLHTIKNTAHEKGPNMAVPF